MPHRILEQSGWFDFSEARPVVEERLDILTHGIRANTEVNRYFDFLMLTAAEAALVAPGRQPLSFREVPPVAVDAVAAHIAVFKADSSPTWPHIPSDLHEARLWDVMLFAGDMSKVARLVGESLEVVMSRGGFADVIKALRTAYQNADNSVAAAVSNGPMLDLLGVVWHAKASLIVDPEGADESVTRYLRRVLPPPAAASGVARF
jgi:hypothetical protein